MRRRKRQSTPPGPSTEGFHHHPFRRLALESRSTLRTDRPGRQADLKPQAGTVVQEESDDDLFCREMSDVRPLPSDDRLREHRPPPTPLRPIVDPDAEALAMLCDLVTGNGDFDIADTVEYVEGSVVGLDRRLLHRLRSGEFAYQSHLDLHGMTAQEARTAVDQFLTRAYQRGQRCVLIIHGRGLNSRDQVPVLKRRLANWLARGPWARLVLAFTSARLCDGGAGALYVLLRRYRQPKRPIRVTEGAKW